MKIRVIVAWALVVVVALLLLCGKSGECKEEGKHRIFKRSTTKNKNKKNTAGSRCTTRFRCMKRTVRIYQALFITSTLQNLTLCCKSIDLFFPD